MVLARKYRPRYFHEIIGQDSLVSALVNAITLKQIPHAFLFHGIRGTGKTTTARVLAKSLNCLTQGPTINPCGICVSCKGFEKESHVDVIEMDAASHTSVENIREIVDSSRYRPVNANFKIFIIDEVHMLSKSAFNALLKTLEEPPEHVKFIFATTELKKIPETILSRCLRFDLKRIENSLMFSHLTKILTLEQSSAEDDALAAIVRAAGGSVRDALSLLDQAVLLSNGPIAFSCVKSMLGLADRFIMFEAIKSILESDAQKVLEITTQASKDGVNPITFVESLMDIVYFLATSKAHPLLEKDLSTSLEEQNFLNIICQKFSITTLLRVWQSLLKGYEDLVKSPNPNQALDILVIKLCFVSDLPPLETILKKMQGGEAQQTSQPFFEKHSNN